MRLLPLLLLSAGLAGCAAAPGGAPVCDGQRLRPANPHGSVLIPRPAVPAAAAPSPRPAPDKPPARLSARVGSDQGGCA